MSQHLSQDPHNPEINFPNEALIINNNNNKITITETTTIIMFPNNQNVYQEKHKMYFPWMGPCYNTS